MKKLRHKAPPLSRKSDFIPSKVRSKTRTSVHYSFDLFESNKVVYFDKRGNRVDEDSLLF